MENGKVSEVWMHPAAHLDDLVAVLILLKRYGMKVGDVRIVSFSSRKPYVEESEAQLRQRGVYVIGFGGGDWDDHTDPNRKVAATDLVAKDLGFGQDEALGRILAAVRENDLAGRGGFMHIADVVRVLSQNYPPQGVLAWLEPAFSVLYEREVAFLKAKAEIAQGCLQIVVPFTGGIRTLLVVESANQQIVRAVRTAFNRDFNLHLVVVRRPDGHTIILGDQRCTPDVVVRDLVAILRVEEQGRQRRIWEWQQLRQDGTLPEVPQWHFEPAGLMILNGSDSAPCTPVTALPLEKVTECAVLALSDLTPTKCQDPCLKKNCSLYAYGLAVCHRQRRNQTRKI